MAANPKPCSIDGCNKPACNSRGWCWSHYQRWRAHGDPLSGRTFTGDPERYFHDVVLEYTGDDCLIWPFGRDGRGYGAMTLNGRRVQVHRAACEQTSGPPHANSEVAHNCGNGHLGCVNPRHLRWATKKENAGDRAVHGTLVRGSAVTISKLTEDQVRTIRQRLAEGVRKAAIAREFSVAFMTITAIERGRTWKWLH
jgi:hypothetical protein